MTKSNRHRLPRCARVLGVLGLIMALLGPNLATTAEAHRQGDTGDMPLDLAAMVLTPDDLAAEDLDGYRVRASEYLDVEEVAARIAEGLDMDGSALLEALENAGLLLSYDHTLDLTDPDDPDFFTTDRVFSYISQYADEEGAGAGFAVREDESGDETSEDLPDAPEIGDESELTRFSGVTDDTGLSFVGLDLTFRAGPIYAGVQVIDYHQDMADLEEPVLDVIEGLANRLLERIEDGSGGQMPDLDGRIIRLDGEDPPVFTIQDYYEVRDGAFYPQVGAPDDVVDANEEIIDEFDILDRYRLEQVIQVGSAPSAEDPYIVIRISRFSDEDDAVSWVSGPIARLDDTAFYTDLEEIEDVDISGEAAVAASYSFEYDESTTVEGHVVFVQVGDLGVQFEVDNASLESLIALAEDQVDCMEDANCHDPIVVPDALLGET